MSISSFVLAHGEKLLVAVVACGCGLVLWSSSLDESITPKNDPAAIEAANALIESGFRDFTPPTLKPVRPYLEELHGRLEQRQADDTLPSWLTVPPDTSNNLGTGLYLYVYHIDRPKLQFQDAVGTLELTVTNIPKATVQVKADTRISALANVRWERKDPAPVINTARILGVQLQLRTGDGEWRPLVAPGVSPEGLVLFGGNKTTSLSADGTLSLRFRTAEPWQLHAVRARLVASATTIDLDAALPTRPKNTVVILPGTMVPRNAIEENRFCNDLSREITARAGERFKALLRPTDEIVPPASQVAGEKLYTGAWDQSNEIVATDKIRFALVRASTEADENKAILEVCTIELFTLVQKGEERKWTTKPFVQKNLKVGDSLGASGVAHDNPFNPGGPQINLNFSTPFVIEKIQLNEERIKYWHITPKQRQGGDRGRDLQALPKTMKSHIVTLKDPKSGATKELLQLGNLNVSPALRPNEFMYPHRLAAVDESAEFRKSPNGFVQRDRTPQKPREWKSDQGPLPVLRATLAAQNNPEADNCQTDTIYFELPDRRLIWWDKVGKMVKPHDPLDVMSAASTTPVIPEPVPTPEPVPVTP